MLLEAVDKYGNSDWNQITAAFPFYRNKEQCCERLMHLANQDEPRERWTVQVCSIDDIAPSISL